MPRSKPSREGGINVHRIELGAWERERYKRAEMVTATAVLLPAAGIAVAGLGAGFAAYALYQWLRDGPFTGWIETMYDEEGISKLWGKKNPLLQVIPNLGWLRGGEYSAWW